MLGRLSLAHLALKHDLTGVHRASISIIHRGELGRAVESCLVLSVFRVAQLPYRESGVVPGGTRGETVVYTVVLLLLLLLLIGVRCAAILLLILFVCLLALLIFLFILFVLLCFPLSL